MTTASNNTESLIMLGRIEGKLDSMIATVTDHSGRIHFLEKASADSAALAPQFFEVQKRVDILQTLASEARGTGRGIRWLAGAACALGGALAPVLAWLAAHYTPAPPAPVRAPTAVSNIQ